MHGISQPELTYRLRQQSLLAEFGLHAMQGEAFDALLHRAAELCAAGMDAELAKVLEFLPGKNMLLVRAGVGWRPGVVGHAMIGADMESPAGYALKTGQPIISNHLGTEQRFRTPHLMAEHGVQRAINVIIRGQNTGQPFGVLEVDSRSEKQFTEADTAFMQGFANLLGVAIERRRLEAARHESAEQLRIFIEGVSDHSIIVTDPDGRVASWNAGADTLFGWASEEIVGQSAALLFTPEDRAQGVLEQELQQAREQGRAPDRRWHVRKDGSSFYVTGEVRPLCDSDGRLRGFVKLARDDTERRHSADALRDSEERLRLAQESGGVGVWDWNADTGAGIFSPTLERLYGLTPGTVHTHDDLRRLTHPDDLDRVEAERDAALARGEVFDIEYRILHASGETRWIVARGRAVHGADGRIARVLGVKIDISERKRAERHQRLLLDELNHRVKNTLAVVQSIAAQTLQGVEMEGSARDDLEGRLIALSSAHDLLTSENWEGAKLRDVVLAALEPFGIANGHADCFDVMGENLHLRPKAALALAMAFHELATNAAKYGPLSTGQGRIEIGWEVAVEERCKCLKLHWRESGGPPVEKPRRRGFGSRLIERGLARELNGVVNLAFEPSGVVCSIDMLVGPNESEG